MKKVWTRILVVVSVFTIALTNINPIFASLNAPQIQGSDAYSTGNNVYGMIGTGTGQFHKIAAEFQLPAGLTVKKVIQSYTNTYVVASDDQLYSAGGNFFGELGAGDMELHATPVKFQLPAGLTVVSVHTYTRDYYDGAENLFVRASDGNVYATGGNMRSMLGNGASTSFTATTPVKFNLPAGVTALDVSVHEENVHVLGSDGNVYSAGNNGSGQLGDGTQNPTSTPVKLVLPAGQTVVKFAEQHAYYEDTLAVVTVDGSVYSVGDNYAGKMGGGVTTSPQLTAVKFQLPGGVTAVSAHQGESQLVVIGSDGQVYSAGRNSGEFGNGTTVNSATPVKFQLPGGLTAQKVFIPIWRSSIVVLASDGQLYGSGAHSGAFGTGSTTAVSTPVKYPLPAGVSALDALVTYDTVLVRADDNNMYVSGYNGEGQLGTGGTATVMTPTRYNVPAGLSVTSISGPNRDYLYTVHAVAGGRVFGSGTNSDSGALGNGNLNDTNLVEEMVLPSGVIAKEVMAYRDRISSTTCALSTTNKLYCAARNLNGQLGDGGETAYALTPQKFTLPAGVEAVATYHPHAKSQFVLGSDGDLYGTGGNSAGMLGNGTVADQYTPVRFGVPAGVSIIDVAFLYFGSGQQILALGSDGNVYGAGEGSGGALGNGSTANQSTPQRYNLPAGVKATGFLHSKGDYRPVLVKGDDGNVYSAGRNNYGQIGNGISGVGSSSTPARFQLPAGITARKIASTSDNMSVLGSDGNVYSAGRNNMGQLGDGTTVNKSVPVKFILPAGLTAVDVMANWEQLYVLASDGQIYGAGSNQYGQLGDGTTLQRNTPVRFQLPAGVTVASFQNAIVTEMRNMSVLASDGKVYSTGSNSVADYYGTQYSSLGTGAPSSGVSIPTAFILPAGITAKKILDSNHPQIRFVLGSDNQIYSVGLNEHGEFGNGTTVGSSTPVKVPLPAGLTVTEAWADAASLIMRTSSSDLYSTGCNAIGTRCDGMLGTGSSADVLTAQKVVMPAGTELFKLDGNNYSNFGFTTRPKNAVGGNVYCDANGSGAQDIGESLVNGETVTLYPSAGGVVSGAALATYTTEEFNGDGGVFFFDNLLQGEYIIGFNSVDGELFSEPVTLSSAGDGWILGSSKYIATASAVGQTGFVCGASTTIPSSPAPTPSTPGTPSIPSLSNTGTAIYTVLLMAGALLVVSTLLVTRHIFRTAGLNR